MYSPPQHPARSPPPLQHPIPTHPPRQVPDPPGTPTPAGAGAGAGGAGGAASGSSSSAAAGADPHMTSARSRNAAPASSSLASAPGSSGTPYARYSSPPIASAPQQHSQHPQHPQHPQHDPYSQQQQQQHYTQQQQQQHAYGSVYPNDPYGPAAAAHSHSFGSAMAQGYPAATAATTPGSGLTPNPQNAAQTGMHNNTFGNFLPNDPGMNMTAQMGMHFGQQMASVGGEYVQKNIGTYLPTMATLRPLFNVSNSYVLHKMRVILFPWRHRPWSRAHRAPGSGGVAVGGVTPAGSSGSVGGGVGGGAAEWQSHSPRRATGGGGGSAIVEGYAPPREDVNAPDLYIPVMSFVTYVLLISVTLGFSHKFRPEVLGLTSTRALVIVGIELAFVRLACYLLNVQGDHYGILDLLSYAGYKFVPACVTLAASILGLGRLVWWASFVYTHAALAFFLLRSLRQIILPDAASAPVSSSSPSVATITHSQRNRRVQLLFVVAMLQFFLGAGLCFRVGG